MATAPRPGRVTDAGPDELHVIIKIDETPYTVWPELLNASDARAIRVQVGMSLRKLIELSQDDPDLDIIAALVWVARCQAGEKVDLATVADDITYGSQIGIEQEEKPLEEDHPSS